MLHAPELAIKLVEYHGKKPDAVANPALYGTWRAELRSELEAVSVSAWSRLADEWGPLRVRFEKLEWDLKVMAAILVRVRGRPATRRGGDRSTEATVLGPKTLKRKKVKLSVQELFRDRKLTTMANALSELATLQSAKATKSLAVIQVARNKQRDDLTDMAEQLPPWTTRYLDRVDRDYH